MHFHATAPMTATVHPASVVIPPTAAVAIDVSHASGDSKLETDEDKGAEQELFNVIHV